jgi:DNA-binding transcriptional regulator GbsR (MarR family)
MGAEDKIHSMFTAVVRSMGYSEVHGRIISSLFVADKDLSLQELGKRTGYSIPSISISLDLLELIGIIKKKKRVGDRKLYVRLNGDLLEGLRKALLMKMQKELVLTMDEFDSYRGKSKGINKLEKELKRLEKYINSLAAVKIPKKT